MSDRILILGGSHAQIPAILRAKKYGYYTIICDYLVNNPGRKYADEYHNISTTDKELILSKAKEKKVDYILAYASDPAAPTAAFVAEELGLPGNSYRSVCKLTQKDQFRTLLHEGNFHVPHFRMYHADEINDAEISEFRLPLMVKPVDSSGSKGVRKINSSIEFHQAAEYALGFSKSGKIIVEEYIDNKIADLHGDGFVLDGELVFCCLGDHLYCNKVNPFNPVGTTWPSKLDPSILQRVQDEIADFIRISGFKNGPVNIEVRINSENKIYIMEIGPRNGGHYVPQAIKHHSGFDFIGASFDLIAGKSIGLEPSKKTRSCIAYYALHSELNGKLTSVKYSDEIKNYIVEKHIYTKIRGQVQPFHSSNSAIGILLMKFDTESLMHNIMRDIDSHISIGIRDLNKVFL